jgi:hypothetical protein
MLSRMGLRTPLRTRLRPPRRLRAFSLALLVACCDALCANAQSPSGGDAAAAVHHRLDVLNADVQHRVGAGATIDTRDLGNAAFTTLLHGGDPSDARRDIDLAFSKQDLRVGSPTYGEITWRTTDSGITDLNAAPFFGQGLAAVLSGYGGRLPTTYVAGLRPKIEALAQAIVHQPVAVTYTNIYLTRAVDLILLGHAIGEPGLETIGREALREWIAATRERGISEFDSATYYAADVEALSELFRFATDANDRTTARVALEYFWTDIAANYLPAAHKLSGPSSREYDFISGNDAIAYWLEGVGWDATSQLNNTNMQAIYIEDLIANGGYRPPEALRDIAFGPPRDVTSTYDAYPGHTRFNWVGRNVSLGCAGGSYGPQDKLLVATFAGPAKSSQLNVLLQKSGVAYGIQSATVKPDHVSPTLGCIEQGGAAIANFDVDMRLLGPTPNGFETDVLFPIGAALTVNGTPVSLTHGDVTLRIGDILAVASGGGVVALRAIRIDDVGMLPTLTLTTDAKAAARGAAWLRIQHLAPGVTARAGSSMRETFLMVARDDGSAQAATADIERAGVQDRFGPTSWQVDAQFPQGHFQLVRSSTNRGAIDLGSIDGRPAVRLPLAINGRDAASPIWEGLP